MASSIMMASTFANKLVDGDGRASKVKRWLSKISRPDTWPAHEAASFSASTMSAEHGSDREPSIADDATLFNPPPLPQRNRAPSAVSDDSVTSMSLSCYTPSTSRSPQQVPPNTVGQGNTPLINSSHVDIAIAMAVRARQEDRMGNSETAARLFAGALERLSMALRDPTQVKDMYVRERLTMLKLLLESGEHDPSHTVDYARMLSRDASPLAAISSDACGGPSDNTISSSSSSGASAVVYSSQEAMNRAVGNIHTTLLITAARALELANQALILWLVFLGNLFVWAAVQFKNSQLPETAAKYLVRLGVWAYNMCIACHVPEHAVRCGHAAMGWLLSLDRETHFSQKMLASSASILSAVARVAEDLNARSDGEPKEA